MGSKKVFLGFKEAREISRSLGFNTYTSWREYASSKKRPYDMPYNPDVVYKNKGWISWVDWLDPKVINRNIPFMDFQKAREIIRSLSLGGWKEWRTHCSSAEKNPLIPRHPEDRKSVV